VNNNTSFVYGIFPADGAFFLGIFGVLLVSYFLQNREKEKITEKRWIVRNLEISAFIAIYEKI